MSKFFATLTFHHLCLSIFGLVINDFVNSIIQKVRPYFINYCGRGGMGYVVGGVGGLGEYTKFNSYQQAKGLDV